MSHRLVGCAGEAEIDSTITSRAQTGAGLLISSGSANSGGLAECINPFNIPTKLNSTTMMGVEIILGSANQRRRKF